MSQRQQVRLLCFLAGVLGIALVLRWWSLAWQGGRAAEWVGAPLATAHAAGSPPPAAAREVAEVMPDAAPAADEAPAEVEDGARVLQTSGCAPLLDLNAATQADLETLPGIGPVIARAIVAERVARGGFVAVEDLLAVKGIGTARFARIASFVCVPVSEKP